MSGSSPKTRSIKNAKQKINNIEENRISLEEKFNLCNEKIGNIFPKVKSRGIIDIIIAIINLLIDFVQEIIQFILDVMQLGELILTLIDAIMSLFDLIATFIAWIMNLFNP